VLVVLFWLWVLVALGVYGFRIWRRLTKGPKAERNATAAGATEPSGGRRGRARRAAPPLPDGPVEARLPRALQDQAPPLGADPTAPDAGRAPHPGGEPVGLATPLPTVAEAVQGIRMPDGLLPEVDPTDPAQRDGRLARFSGPGTTVEVVTGQLASELERLGFTVDGLATATPVRARLSAHRADATLAATVSYDDDSTAVVVELTTA
jgi:hypothetical protein